MYRIAIILIFGFCVFACGTDTSSDEATTNTETETTTTPKRQGIVYPSIPQAMMERLGKECDQLDYTFLELPFSLSANETAAKGSVMSFLRHISTTPAIGLPDCPRLAKIYYQTKGEIILEADFYFSGKDECRYLVFYEDNKPKYANYLTAEANAYYMKIFQSVQTSTQ